MKKYTFLLGLLLLSLFLKGQEKGFKKGANSFFELNGGVALIDAEFVFPGVSVLLGQTYVDENNLVFEYEIGLAAPSIGTAKIGFGKKFNNTLVTMGLRPFPFNLYLQTTFGLGQRGYWLASVEANPLGTEHRLSFQSAGLVTFGYRFHLGR